MKKNECGKVMGMRRNGYEEGMSMKKNENKERAGMKKERYDFADLLYIMKPSGAGKVARGQGADA